MPKTLTDEEFADLEGKVKKGEEATTKLAEIEPQIQTLTTELDEAKKGLNPNWSEIRAKEKRLKALLKGKGVETDEEGNQINQPQLTAEQIEERTRSTVRSEHVNIRKDELLGDIEDPLERGEVEKAMDKLMAGEKVDLKNIKDYFKKAVRAAFPDDSNKVMDIISGSHGQGPRPPKPKSNEGGLSDEAAEAMGENLGIDVKPKEEKK
jgi:hypothetical protein